MSELIDAHARHLRAARRSPHTINSRVRLLHALHAWLPFGLAYASTDELEEYLGHEPTWSDWSVSTYAAHIRGFYRWAAGQYLQGDPSAAMARPRSPGCVPRPVSDDEMRTALARSGPGWHEAIILASYAGLRISELCGVHREHVTEQVDAGPQLPVTGPAAPMLAALAAVIVLAGGGILLAARRRRARFEP